MTSMKHACVWLVLAVAAAGAARAEPGPSEPRAASTAAAVPLGARTRAWLELQRQEGRERRPRRLPLEAEGRALERYLQSFTHPIPEQFDLDRLDKNEH